MSLHFRKNRLVRYAVVGVGNIAQAAVLPAFKHASFNSELVALVSSDARKRDALPARTGVRFCADYDGLEDLIADAQIDAIYLATPNAQHRLLAQRAMEAGAHVLVEKPMSMTSGDCQAMIQTAQRTQRKLMVGYRLHFDEATLTAIELARSGKLGELRSFSSVFTHQVREGDIRTQRLTGGGALYDLGPDPLNMVRHLFDAEPTEVIAFQANQVDVRSDEVDEMTTAILRFPDERLAQFVVSQGAASIAEFRVTGTKGDLRVEPAFKYAGPQTHHLTVHDRTTTRHFPQRDQFAPELVHFSKCILEDLDPEPSGEEGFADVAILEALAQSAATGRSVRLPPKREPNVLTLKLEQHMPPVGKVKPVHAPSPTL